VKTRRLLVALGAAQLVVAGLTACSFDFDRFDPIDASTESSRRPDATSHQDAADGGDLDEAASQDGEGEMAIDASPIRDATRDEAASCTPSPDCFRQGESCGASCELALRNCMSNCGNPGTPACRQCKTTDQTCLDQCATACTDCTQEAGCAAPNGECLDAASAGQ
jgi:hypothetical protein